MDFPRPHTGAWQRWKIGTTVLRPRWRVMLCPIGFSIKLAVIATTLMGWRALLMRSSRNRLSGADTDCATCCDSKLSPLQSRRGLELLR